MAFIMMLPDDLVLNCFARVSRLYYPILSLVSKRFRSLLASPTLYQNRIFLNRTESCLYLGLRIHTGSNPLLWFTLCMRPNSSRRILVPISSPNPSSLGHQLRVAAVGPNIYAIGGITNKNASSSVMVMDCGSYTWHEAPNMQIARLFPSVCVLDEKIYVTGGCKTLDPKIWTEVFDIKTQTWEFLQSSSKELCRDHKYLALDMGWSFSSSYCMIENVFYRYKSGRRIDWYDHKERLWTTLKGLEMLPMFLDDVKLAEYGGKLAVLWKKYDLVNDLNWKTIIWCAEIVIERRQNREIWGKIEWFDVVYTTNETCTLMHVLSTTV